LSVPKLGRIAADGLAQTRGLLASSSFASSRRFADSS